MSSHADCGPPDGSGPPDWPGPPNWPGPPDGSGPTDPFGPPIRLGRFAVRPARTADELAEVLALRALAFRTKPPPPTAPPPPDAAAGARDRGHPETDRHDADCLHLRVAAPGGTALATLRLQLHPAGRIAGYAARFHDLGALAAAPGRALELGRLCLRPGQGDPTLVRLLWAGVARLALRGGAARLIGCTSFPGADPAAHAPALGLLAARHQGPPALRPDPRPGIPARPLSDWLARSRPEAAATLPPLLRGYLALGGWVSGHLVIDPDLDTCHIFTCVEIATLPEARKRALRRLAGAID